jgi:hypothetical protein
MANRCILTQNEVPKNNRMKHIALSFAWMAAALGGLAADTPPSLSPPAPALSLTREGTNVRLTYTGTLQAAEASNGPWTNVLNAPSPQWFAPTAPLALYRARTSASIFASTNIVNLTLVAPFQENFALAHAGEPDGIFPPVREKPYFDGTLHMTGIDLPVSLRVRGNSSLQECPFPKLKFKVAKDVRAGTPFFDAREVKLGTHCAEGGRGPIGRLREETAAYREALAYETMQILGFITPRVRRAQVDYHDITPTNHNANGGWQVSRDGFILDDIEVVAERLSGRALDNEELEHLTNANFDVQLLTDLKFFHALLGNWDFKLPADGVGLWNTDVIEFAGGTLVPVAGDFDLASWVTGIVRVMAPSEYHPELPDADRQPRYELEQLHQSVSPTHFSAARQRFENKRAAIELQISSALIDEPGRTNAQQHVTAFFNALSAVAR